MTIEQLQADIAKLTEEMIQAGKVFGQAVAQVHGEIGLRIFEQGLAADDTEIGQYSEKPAYYRFPGKAKGKFYEGGYKEFRADNGLGDKSDKVYLVLSRVLQTDFNTGLRKMSLTKYVARVKNQANADKIAEMEHKYSKEIFGASDAEQQRIVDLINQNLTI